MNINNVIRLSKTTTVELATEGTSEICTPYPKICYKGGKQVVNMPPGNFILHLICVKILISISEGVISKFHCIIKSLLFAFMFILIFHHRLKTNLYALITFQSVILSNGIMRVRRKLILKIFCNLKKHLCSILSF